MCDYKILLFCVLNFLIHVPTGSSLKCGVCTSELNPDCRDPTKVTKFEECNQKQEFVCRTLEYYVKKENTVHVTRNCVLERDGSNNDACSKVRLIFYAQVNKCQTCKTDLCNVDRGSEARGSGARKTDFEENFAVPKPKGSSAAIRSSFCIVITFLFFNLYKTYIML